MRVLIKYLQEVARFSLFLQLTRIGWEALLVYKDITQFSSCLSVGFKYFVSLWFLQVLTLCASDMILGGHLIFSTIIYSDLFWRRRLVKLIPRALELEQLSAVSWGFESVIHSNLVDFIRIIATLLLLVELQGLALWSIYLLHGASLWNIKPPRLDILRRVRAFRNWET